MALTFLRVKNAEPRSRGYKLADEKGLYLFVGPNGSKLWRMDYRFGDKRKTLSFGAYPDLGLSDAREKRDAARTQIAANIDPASGQPKAIRAAERKALDSPERFRLVAERWRAKMAGRWKPWYANRVKVRLEQDVYSEIGERVISDITAPDILALVRKVEMRGALDVARRVRAHCSLVFQFAIGEGIADRDPARDIVKALVPKPRVKHRSSLQWKDVPEFLSKLDSYDGDPLTPIGLELTLLTMVRTGETRFASWNEFEGLDGPEPLWRIPADRMKMANEHLVPLPRQAVNLLKRLRGIGVSDQYLFPAETKTGFISENTMLYAMYRMGYHGRATVHGLRGLASTYLNERDFNRDWIERQLAHVEKDEVRGAYNSAQWMPQRRSMLQHWADALDMARLG